MFKTSLTKKEYDDITVLEEICNSYDNVNYKIIRDDNPYATDIHYNLTYKKDILVSVVSYIEYTDECELSALTHPQFRNMGYAHKLISEINSNLKIYYSISSFLDSSRHKFYCTEYQLTSKPFSEINLSFNKNEFSLKKEAFDDCDTYTLFYQNNTALGHLNATYVNKNTLVIWDVYIEKEYRNQKLSYILFLMLYETLDKNTILELNVNSQNTYAYKAYKKLGFTTKEKIDYYIL